MISLAALPAFGRTAAASRAMSSMTLSILLYLTLGLVAAAALILVLRAAQGQSVFRPRPIMTDNEVEFFRRLVAAWPEGYVFPQVAMTALLKPAATTSRAHRAAFDRISQKRVDYAIYTADMELHCVVELDDRSHNAQRDARRDAWLASAGIVTLRFTQKDKPAAAELRERLRKKQPTTIVATTPAAARTSTSGRPSTVQATPKPRPATISTPQPGASAASSTPPAAKRPAPAKAAGAPAPARSPARTPAPAPTAVEELEMLEFSPATAAPGKR